MTNFTIDPISQFKVRKILNITLLGMDISLTNAALMMIFGLFLFIAITTFGIRKKHAIPSKFQSAIEILYIFIQNLCKDNIVKESAKYEGIIATIFLYILLGNLIGMIPFSFTFTSQIVVTFILATIVFIISVAIGIIKHGLGFFAHFMPSGTPIYLAPLLVPIEIISFLSRPFSLAIRLFANIVAGHAMIKVFASFVIILGVFWGVLPFTMNVILTGFEMMVAFLQSYIFAILSCIYVSEAINMH